MELIPYNVFAKLRMKQFVPTGTEVFESDGWEWMGGIWINEGIPGFTSISRHEDTPDEAGGLEVDFRDLSPTEIAAVFEALHLPLQPGMTSDQLRSVLGVPDQTDSIYGDRRSHSFTIGADYPYLVSTTVHDAEGLIYVTVVRKDVLARCDDA
jgi:hypothetical protein